MDVFFYGYGDKFRGEWIRDMVGDPSRRLPQVDFALGGRDFQGDVGRAREVGDVPYNIFCQSISQPRINLNITRRAHASVPASSTARPFELAMAGAAIVSNPCQGIERWFEPGRELLVVSSAEEATDAYEELLDDPGRAEELGRAARERALDEHRYVHRARDLLELVGLEAPVAVGVRD
jgi:spore maturation protein CgeB